MRFIKKKNFHEGEELLYAPMLHWMYTVRHLILSLPFFILLLILWNTAGSVSNVLGFFGLGFEIYKIAIRNIFLIVLIIDFLILGWRIYEYLSYEYGVTNKRLMMKTGFLYHPDGGFFCLYTAEIPTDRIESIYCKQGILGRLFKYGTIFIGGVGGKTPVFYMVNRPYALRRKIVEIVEKNKSITVVHGDLPKPEPVVIPEPVVVEEPMYRYGTFVRVISGDGTK
jgi:uncharacterized membrane protein YdbT with pleckstrin-like domain